MGQAVLRQAGRLTRFGVGRMGTSYPVTYNASNNPVINTPTGPVAFSAANPGPYYAALAAGIQSDPTLNAQYTASAAAAQVAPGVSPPTVQDLITNIQNMSSGQTWVAQPAPAPVPVAPAPTPVYQPPPVVMAPPPPTAPPSAPPAGLPPGYAYDSYGNIVPIGSIDAYTGLPVTADTTYPAISELPVDAYSAPTVATPSASSIGTSVSNAFSTDPAVEWFNGIPNLYLTIGAVLAYLVMTKKLKL